jgi:hypothetical protein
MSDVRGHERVTVAPAAEFRNGLRVVGEPMAVECITGPRLKGNVKRMHNAGVEKGFPDGRPPAETRVVERFRVLRIDRDD